MTRRRKVLFVVGLGLIGVAIRGVSQLSMSTVTRMQDLCTTDFVDPTSGNPVTLHVPCNPAEVTEVASWRWPAMLVVVVVIAAASGLMWLMMPRLTTGDGRRVRSARLSGRALRGSRVRYRLHPVLGWSMSVLAALFLIGGILLGALPTGAPAAIVVYFIVCGVLFAYEAGSGVVTASADRLTVRTNFRRRVWRWSQIERLDAVDGFAGPARTECRLLAIRTVDGRVFTSRALSSAPNWEGVSRIDQLVVALDRWRDAHAHPSGLPVEN